MGAPWNYPKPCENGHTVHSEAWICSECGCCEQCCERPHGNRPPTAQELSELQALVNKAIPGRAEGRA